MQTKKLKAALKSLTGLLLLILLVFETSGTALAYMVEDARTAHSGVTITDAKGEQTTPDESWVTTFPYGTFAFEKSSLAVGEGKSDVIRVYRLGGTTGRATAYVTYEPVVTKNDDEEAVYAYALSADDLDILVEEPQPAAQYQPIGKAPEPEQGTATVVSAKEEQGYVLTLSEPADGYQWQVLSGKAWENIELGTRASLSMDASFLDEGGYDYRCIYQKSGVRYCTASLNGAAYVKPPEETVAPMPEGIELNAEPVYTPLALRGEGAQPYDGWAFELVFADGEWVKEIHIDAHNDELSEAAEAATMTIRDCEGGSVYDSANTLLLRVEDANEPQPSTLGFTVGAVTVDKATGSATLMIERVGGGQRPVTIQYETADGTAIAGRDYAKAKGTLLFYVGVERLPVRVELIDDGKQTEDTVEFNVTLSELLGDDACTLTTDRATVALYNSGTGSASNLVSQLYDPEAVDLADAVADSDSAANSGSKPVTGTQVAVPERDDGLHAALVEPKAQDQDGISTQVYQYGNGKLIDFSGYRGQAGYWGSGIDLASKNYWQVSFDKNYDEPSTTYTALLGSGESIGKLGSGVTQTIDRGVALASRNAAQATLTNAAYSAMGGDASVTAQLFSKFASWIKADCAHDTAYLQGATYRYSYTFPRLRMLRGDYMYFSEPAYIKRFGSGPFDASWSIRTTNDKSKDANYVNPFEMMYSFDLGIGDTRNTNFLLDMMYYDNVNSHTDDVLNDYSMIWLKSLNLSRRVFAQNAFSLEISTPNDANTAPANCAVLDSTSALYNNLVPKVEIATGGVGSSNNLFTGTTLKITAPAAAPENFKPRASDGLAVYQSTDGGKTWHSFTKFQISYNAGDKSYAVRLVSSGSNPLSQADLNASYKFRLVYERQNKITLDLSPSVPRLASDATGITIDTSKSQVAWNAMYGSVQGKRVALGVSNSVVGADYTKAISAQSQALPQNPALTVTQNSAVKWSFDAVNVQSVCFNLPKEDIINYNGQSYPGDATIYLNKSDIVGKEIVFRYYAKAYQTALSAMVPSILSTEVYWDANGNGVIDGYFDEQDGLFHLAANADEFVGYVADGSYNETMFAPKKNAAGKYCAYFLKLTYSMTPRCIIVPNGAKESDRAQVLPAFVTALNADTPAYAELSQELKAYRYLVSGKTKVGENGSLTRSSDGHAMYGDAASKKSTVDVPLGGDFSPAALKADQSGYTWTPKFYGNLLYPFASPEPITIPNSVAGVTPVTDKYTMTRDADHVITGYSYSGDGLARMNGYLGSFTGTSTCALVSQQQTHTTEEILAGVQSGVRLGGGAANVGDDTLYVQDAEAYAVKPDSVAVCGVTSFPDAEYLKELEDSGSKPEGGGGMDGSGSAMPEFNVDFGMDFGSNEVAVTDYVSVVMDGNKVGFAIGIPLGEVGGEKKGFATENKEKWTQFSDFFNDFGNANKSYTDAKTASTAKKPQSDSAYKSRNFAVEFTVGIAFMFEYNPLDNGYYFEGMTISVSAALKFRAEMRLSVCPLIYIYFEFGASIEAGSGLGVIRDTVTETTPQINGKSEANKDKRVTLKYLNPAKGETKDYYLNTAAYNALSAENKASYRQDAQDTAFYYHTKYASYAAAKAAYLGDTSYEFETTAKAFVVRFSGKLSVDVYTMQGGVYKPAPESSGFVTGFLNSDGSADTQVVLKKQDGMDLGETVKIVLRPLDYDMVKTGDETVVSYLARVTAVRSDVYWKGISISPSVYIEIGAGLGVELLKIELYAKVSLEASFLLGVYNTNYDPTDSLTTNDEKYKPATVESFGFSIGIGLRVVLLAFTFELDAATYCVDYDKNSGWETGWHFLNDMVGQSYALGRTGVTIRLPQSAEQTQQLYTPADNAEEELSTQAYDPTDKNVPFQLSGYGSSVDAAKLATGLAPGSAYKVVNAGGRNFIVYTITRANAASVAEEDYAQLVLSELTGTNTAAEGETPVYKYGLAHPTDPKNATPYLVLDDDGTGDLDFDVWTEQSVTGDVTTYRIHAAWVSYAAPAANLAAPDRPSVPVYQHEGTEMTAENYLTIAAPVAPTAPQVSAYYTTAEITVEAYGKLDEAGKALCEEIKSGDSITGYTQYTLAAAYTTIQQAKDAYQAAESAYQTAQGAYVQANASYTAWHAYFAGVAQYEADVQARAKNAARNTVLKAASWDYTSTAGAGEPVIANDPAFTAATTLAGDGLAGTMNYLFLPASAASGDAVFFGSTHTPDAGDADYQKYAAYLDAVNKNPDGSPYGYNDYLKSTKQSTLDVYGTTSALNLAYGGKVYSMALAAGQTLGNMEFTKLDDGNYYMAYTTRQYAYEGSAPHTDLVTVERLYLRTVTVKPGESDPQKVVEWGTPYLLRMTRDYDKNTGKDGVYKTQDAALPATAHDSPYFSNLSFLSGKLDKSMLTGTEESFTAQADPPVQTFLLYEMNGSTYIILQDSLQSITGAEHKGTIYPFFTGNAHDGGTDSASGKLEVTIGADSGGTLFAVYVGAVPNTTNNALYLATFDAEAGKWGEGVMLAMNNMNTYEASVRYGWDSKTAQAAFLGLSGTGSGLLTKEDIDNLYGGQDTDTTAIYEALSTHKDDRALGDKTNLVFANLQAVRGSGGELLVVTQGTMTNMAVAPYKDKQTTRYAVMPEYKKDGAMDSKLGTYAISYGKGVQSLGEGSIAFDHADFSAGSKLGVELNFVNTGNTAFRGSAAGQPITVKLYAGVQELAQWPILDSIHSGQPVSLKATCAALTNDLPAGTVFSVEVSEYQGAGYQGVTKTLDLFTVQTYPDLAVEDLNVSVASVSEDGLHTTLNVDFVAANRGSGPASGVYIQFTHADGKDANGKSTYATLDLSGDKSALTINREEKLKALTASENEEKNLKQGILYLYNAADGNNDLKAGYGRRVSGTITVPSAAFAAGESGGLELNLEIFDGSDRITGLDAGVVTAQHNEYYAANNKGAVSLQAITGFRAPGRVILPLGSTTLLPVAAVSSRGSKPALSTVEVADIDGLNLGILNFKQSTAVGGSVSGVLSITPAKLGTGVIHLYDTATNEYTAIAFEVANEATGIDIYRDNEAFAFQNAGGTPYDQNGTNQSWQFSDAPVWGSGANEDVPYRRNLSLGAQGASFRFTTVAESIDLYFMGNIEVSSTFSGYKTAVYENSAGGKSFTNIRFGLNPGNVPFIVTVTVKSAGGATFDRMVEHYGTAGTPKPEYDGTSPAFYWSRSFPATASIASSAGTKIPLVCYVLDNNGLSYLTVNGTRYDAASSELQKMDGTGGLLWAYAFGDITANGTYRISATDISGNTTSTELIVDWFHTTASGDAATVAVPKYDAAFRLDTAAWTGTPIGKEEVAKLNITVSSAAGNPKTEGNTLEVHRFDGTDFAPVSGSGAAFPIGNNGIYWARAVNTDKTWCASFLYMNKVDANLPVVTLQQNGKALEWSAAKDKASTSTAAITEVKINGYRVNAQTGTNLYGTLPIAYSGSYTLTAVDSAGNSSAVTLAVSDLKVDLAACTFTTVDAWDQAGTSGSLTAELANAAGGKYVASSTPSTNTYRAEYEAAVVPEAFDPAKDPAPVWKAATAATTFPNLAVGAWKLLVRDKNNTDDVAEHVFAIGSSAISLTSVTLNASSFGTPDGQALVTVNGGSTTGFEFASASAGGKMAFDKDGKPKPITIQEFLALDTAGSKEDDIVWRTASNPGATLRASTLTGLSAGWHYVAVRGIYGATDAQLAKLTAAYQAMTAAENTLAAAKKAADASERAKAVADCLAIAGGYYDTYAALAGGTGAAAARATLIAYIGGDSGEPARMLTAYESSSGDPAAYEAYQAALNVYFAAKVQSDTAQAVLAATTALTTKQSDCRAAVTEVQTACAAVYTGRAEQWAGAAVLPVQIGFEVSTPSAFLTIAADANGATVFTLRSATDRMTQNDRDRLYRTNQAGPVVLKAQGLAIYIPKGMLTADFDSNRLVVSPEKAKAGMIVRCASGGITAIDPFCLVGDGMLQYQIIGLGDYQLGEGGAAFTDVKGLWGENSILFTANRALFSGTGDGKFSPGLTMNRAMFVTVLWRMANCPKATGTTTFTDLTQDWYREAVLWAAQEGIANGVTADTFDPEGAVSREQMCAFMSRFLRYLGLTPNEKQDAIAFADASRISTWAKADVDACTRAGLIFGVGENRFEPVRSANRMEVSALFERLITALVEKYCG